MAKQLKVYGWTGHRAAAYHLPGARSSQTREVMAAYSAAEVMRAGSISRSWWKHSAGETGNDVEIGLALANPGRILWKRLDDRGESAEWHAADGGLMNPPAKGMTPRRLIDVLQKLPADQKDLPLKLCGGMGAECVDTDNYHLTEMSGPGGKYLTIIEDW